ncbi:SWIM zinc finger family protein [Phytoactinopolyspora limicola]|uniref:SWIM zinc finger family protein n=1 Tax=Phytoactinopolyspora limicola TaxID=2715536 RepID=UPI0014097386|nr:SWIM zinc finger family protein [Phytoactinopolyspora limicola]
MNERRGWFPPPAKPKPVENGIKARSQRGAIAQTWWSGRFVTVLESLGVGGRLQRGRTYARKGQVAELTMGAGLVAASVQGSRDEPYRVLIELPEFAADDWDRVITELGEHAWYAAKLLAGDMPDDIENVFTSVGLSLFPATAGELAMDCSCPDWSVPCKHIAAVFYLMAEAFDADPFTILAWRGRDRAELLAALAALRGGDQVEVDTDHPAVEPLADCLDRFYTYRPPAPARAPMPAPADAILDQLPAHGVTVRGVNVTDALRPAYVRP